MGVEVEEGCVFVGVGVIIRVRVIRLFSREHVKEEEVSIWVEVAIQLFEGHEEDLVS